MYFVYSKSDGSCKYCSKALDLLREKGLTHRDIPCNSLEDVREKSGFDTTTYPLIVYETTRLGGYDALQDHLEPLLQENPLRFTLFPIQYSDMFQMYRKALASFWTPQEISLADDVSDWKEKLSDNDRYFIKHILAFFAGSDGIVMENLAGNFATEVQVPEARQFYASQMMMEAIHSETYALLIDALADPSEALDLFRAIETMPPVQKKAAWAQKYLDPSRRFAERLVAFICVEGILFSGSFCAIYWLKRKGVMPGLCLANEFISRDEALHYDFGILLYKHLQYKLPRDTVSQIIREAVETELDFVVDAIPCKLIGMNSDLMCQYIKFVADRAMMELTGTKLYNVTNPFEWMELIGLQGKTNFFERFPSDYQRAGVMAETQDQTFAIDDEF